MLARVGSMEVHLSRLDLLAEFANEIRQEFGLPVLDVQEPGRKIELALELAVLADAAGKLNLSKKWKEEQRKRLLARRYLKLLEKSIDRLPVTEEQIEAAYEKEWEKVASGQDSDIIVPTRTDAMVVAIGYNPDLQPPEDEEKAVLDAGEAKRVADVARKVLQDAGRDTDLFLERVRGLMEHNPTLRVLQLWKMPVNPRLSRLPGQLRGTLQSIGEGQLSPAVATGGGVFIVRRGVTLQGKGERLAQVKERIIGLVKKERKRSHVKRHIEKLRKKFGARTWPDKLSGDLLEEKGDGK
ncbi:MAG: hypothetical protein D6806_18610 [Deltaproteobacteria bacterium]|nr:MAG: hypothetical protein D6806_18610 [Deltaproteobacteria bacterium]